MIISYIYIVWVIKFDGVFNDIINYNLLFYFYMLILYKYVFYKSERVL